MNSGNKTPSEYDVFISYRRKGGYITAKHIFDLLRHDGYSVSFDLDTLRNGDFDRELLKRIDACKDFILILNPGAFDRSVDPTFDRQKDWMRIELARALEMGKNIIPIRLPEFHSFPDNLPNDIREVTRKNGPSYSQEYFDDFYKRLKNFMVASPKVNDSPSTAKDSSSKFILRIHPDVDCQIQRFGEVVGTARKDEYFPLSLKKGKYRLSFIPLSDPERKKEVEYEVKEVDAEDYYDVVFNPVTMESIFSHFLPKGQDLFSKGQDKEAKKEEKTVKSDKGKSSKENKEREPESSSKGPIKSAAQLGKAIERGDERITVEGSLANNIVKIITVSNIKWKIAGASIVTAIVAILATPFVSFSAILGLLGESLVLSVGGGAAAAILGIPATVAAVSIGVGAKNKNAVNILRKEYSFTKVDGTVFLTRIKQA